VQIKLRAPLRLTVVSWHAEPDPVHSNVQSPLLGQLMVAALHASLLEHSMVREVAPLMLSVMSMHEEEPEHLTVHGWPDWQVKSILEPLQKSVLAQFMMQALLTVH